MLVSDVLMGLAVVALLLWHEPVLTLMAAGGIGALSVVVTAFTHRRLRPLGATFRQITERMYKTTNEAIGGIKEIKVLGREPYFSSLFGSIVDRHANVTVRYMLLTDGPRFVIEILVVGGILAVVLAALSTNGDFAALAGTVALFAAAAYRLMPIAHRMLSSIAGLQFNSAVLDALEEGLALAPAATPAAASKPLPFRNSIRFRDVSFRYVGMAQDAIRGLSFEIPCNRSIAFVGATGAGKTTVVDLMIGLLSPTGGQSRLTASRLATKRGGRGRPISGTFPSRSFCSTTRFGAT